MRIQDEDTEELAEFKELFPDIRDPEGLGIKVLC